MSSNGYYNGSGLNISGAPMGQMQAHGVEAFAQRDIMQSVLNRSQVLGEVQLGVAKLMDYKTETDARLKLDAIQTETETRVKRGLEAAPGSAESFFYEDGAINTGMIDDLGKEVQEKLEGIAPSFIDPNRAQKFAADKDSFSGNLVTRVKGQADLHQLKNIRRASEARMQSLMGAFDWDGALSEIDRQLDAGIISQAEADLKRMGINKAAAADELSASIEDDPRTAAVQLENGRYDGVFSYGEQQQFRRAIRSKLSGNNNAIVQEAVRTGQMPSFPSVVGDGAGSKKAKSLSEFMAGTGDFSKVEINWMQRRFWGEDVTREVQQAAREEALAFDITRDMDEQKEAFMSKYSRLGLTADWLKNVWKDAEGRRESITSVSIDPQELLAKDAMAGRTLLDASLVGEMNAHLAAKDDDGQPWSFKEGSYLRKDKALMELIRADDDDDAIALAAKYEVYQTGVIADLTKKRILAEYNRWRSSDGKEAPPLAQYNKLRDITRRITGRYLGGSANVQGAAQVRNEDAEYRANIQRQNLNRARWEDSVRKQNEKTDLLLHIDEAQQVNLRFDDSQKDKPVGILVPKEWLNGVEMGKATVEATFDNEHFRVFRVVGTCDGDEPLMTYAAAVQGGWNPDASYGANIRFLHGTTAVKLAQMQETAISRARQQQQEEQEQAIRHRGIGGAIFDREARFDRQGRLRVYYLPKDDGGGSYEVAGINNKYHPEMASKLKSLIGMGLYDEARVEAEQYIMHYTQPAANLLSIGGVSDSGIELFLRDVFMNGGPGGMKRVLNRTLGLPDNADDVQTSQKLRYYMNQHTTRELLDALKQKRDEWYAGIANGNPQKRRFLTGWNNRSDIVYKQALNLH